MGEPSGNGLAEDRFLVLGGLRLHYREWGAEDAPPVVLLHGMTAHARAWDTVAAALSDHFRVLTLDQRGHGESDRAADYAWERWCEDVEAFADALRLRGVCLVGHSFGGVVAYMTAARRPETVARLVIVDIGPPPEGTVLPPARGRLAGLPHVFADPSGYVRLLRRLDPEAQEEELRSSARHNLISTADGRWTPRWDSLIRSPDFVFPFPPPETQWAALRALRCPTLLIKGERSSFPRGHADAIAQTIADCRVVEIPAAGHTVHWANPSAFLGEVRPFLLAGQPAAQDYPD